MTKHIPRDPTVNDYDALFKASEDTIYDYLSRTVPKETVKSALKMIVVQSTLLLAREMCVPPSQALTGLLDVMMQVEARTSPKGPNG